MLILCGAHAVTNVYSRSFSLRKIYGRVWILSFQPPIFVLRLFHNLDSPTLDLAI